MCWAMCAGARHAGLPNDNWCIESGMSISATTHIAGVADSFHPDTIQYREYKLLVRADQFTRPQQFHKFWKLTRRVAELAGVEIRKRGKPMETHLREVLFFDTPKFRLYNNDFILRRRTFYKRGLSAAGS